MELLEWIKSDGSWRLCCSQQLPRWWTQNQPRTLVRTSQWMQILFCFDAKLRDAEATRTHLQVETVGEGWRCWSFCREENSVNEESLIPVMRFSTWLRSGCGTKQPQQIKKGTGLRKSSAIWFMFKILVLNRRLRIQDYEGIQSSSSYDLTTWSGGVLAHTHWCVLIPAVTPHVAFIIIPSRSSLNPAQVTALALAHLASHPSNSWRHIMPRWPNHASTSLLQDKNSAVATCSFLGNSSKRCFSLRIYLLLGWKHVNSVVGVEPRITVMLR